MYISLQRLKVINEVTEQQKSRFLLLFSLMMEGSGSVQIITVPDPGWEAKKLTYGSGSTTLPTGIQV